MRSAITRYAHQVLEDAATSGWLRDALRTALERDPVEAAHDADLLRTILFRLAAEAPAPDGAEGAGTPTG